MTASFIAVIIEKETRNEYNDEQYKLFLQFAFFFNFKRTISFFI